MSADLTTSIVVLEQDTGSSRVANSPFGYKEIMVLCPDTADDTDTFDITLASYGITSIETIRGWQHGTLNDVITSETPTTSLRSSGVIRVTVGGSTDNKVRAILLGGI